MTGLEVAFRHRLGAAAFDVDFAATGGVTALFGPSGAGKSTVVKAVAGLLTPAQGRIALGERLFLDTARGIRLRPWARRVGVVFQEARLFPHLSVQGNLRYGQRRARQDKGIRADEVIGLLGLAPLLKRRIGALSGGEAQRVAIGRALLAQPDLLLLDEPLSALDLRRRAELLPYIAGLRDLAGLPIVYVSHSLDEVLRLADQMVLMEAGRCLAAGRVEQVLATDAAAALLGPDEASGMLVGRVRAIDAADGLADVETAAGTLVVPGLGLTAGKAAVLRVRARDVALAAEAPRGYSALNRLAVTVEAVSPVDASRVMVWLRAGEGRLPALITRRALASLSIGPGVAMVAVIKAISVSTQG
jgi:molybdate transport system ATP-binding protein